jgi:hypothetical protein
MSSLHHRPQQGPASAQINVWGHDLVLLKQASDTVLKEQEKK